MSRGPGERAREPEGREVPPTGSVDLGGGVRWVRECFPESGGHLHVSVYLVRTRDGDILVDSGSFYHRESLAARIGEATGGRGIQALILSHSDYPHSGNIPAFRGAWGDFDIVASCAEPDIQGLPYARRARIGDTLEVLGRRFTFIDPPLADRSHTTWVYDGTSRILFVADGFGTIHAAGSCDVSWGELPLEGRAEGVAAFHAQTLRWLRYVDPERLMGTLRGMLERHPPVAVAPIHGPPIFAADLDAFLGDLERAVREIAG